MSLRLFNVALILHLVLFAPLEIDKCGKLFIENVIRQTLFGLSTEITGDYDIWEVPLSFCNVNNLKSMQIIFIKKGVSAKILIGGWAHSPNPFSCATDTHFTEQKLSRTVKERNFVRRMSYFTRTVVSLPEFPRILVMGKENSLWANDSKKRRRIIAFDIRVSNMSYGPLDTAATTCQRSPSNMYNHVYVCAQAALPCPHPSSSRTLEISAGLLQATSNKTAFSCSIHVCKIRNWFCFLDFWRLIGIDDNNITRKVWAYRVHRFYKSYENLQLVAIICRTRWELQIKMHF